MLCYVIYLLLFHSNKIAFTLCIFFAIAGGDIGKMKEKRGTGSGDSYRVLLIDDTRHSEKLGM